MRYHIVHTTRYAGSEPVSVGHNAAWLTPRTTNHQRVTAHSLDIVPRPSVVTTRTDYFGNTVSQFSFNQGYQTLAVTGESDVELQVPAKSQDPGLAWEVIGKSIALHADVNELEAHEFVFDSPRCRRRPEFVEFARRSFLPNRAIVDACVHLMGRIHKDYKFDASATTVSTTVEQFFRQRRGVCQDFAQLMISMVRSLGLAARYVSGYLRTIPPEGMERLAGADASHAWLGVYCGPLGWIDFDPTNNVIPRTDHITCAWGRDYSEITPLKGVYIGGGKLQLTVSVDVVEVVQEPESSEMTLPS